jgi:hypothetical protein
LSFLKERGRSTPVFLVVDLSPEVLRLLEGAPQ